ncbi:MAG: hypothetical protein LBD59_07710, partial [Prevotellaceae bacterium]|nr:hypothetical protein [Prevotellaceae bacterium]
FGKIVVFWPPLRRGTASSQRRQCRGVACNAPLRNPSVQRPLCNAPCATPSVQRPLQCTTAPQLDTPTIIKINKIT